MKIVEVSCGKAGCGYSPFPMEENYYNRVKRTGETWYCPGGHPRCYNKGKTREEIQRETISRLEKQVDHLRRNVNNQVRWRHEAEAERWICRWTGCGFWGANLHGLRTHMRASHGMPTLAQIEEVAS